LAAKELAKTKKEIFKNARRTTDFKLNDNKA
jgi:hypothetical protein